MQKGEIYGFLYIPSGTADALLASRQPKISFYYTMTSLTAAAPAVTALPAAEPHVAACAVGCPSCGGTHQHKDCCEDALTIALVGNPNCGKTAFFNAACGGHERTGNYAGVTVTISVHSPWT